MRARFFTTAARHTRTLTEHQETITSMLPRVKTAMHRVSTPAITQCILGNYHPSNIHHPAQPSDSQLAGAQYGSRIYMTLSLAKEGLVIINGDQPGALQKEHYVAIIDIPALAYLKQHPTMLACAERIETNCMTLHQENIAALLPIVSKLSLRNKIGTSLRAMLQDYHPEYVHRITDTCDITLSTERFKRVNSKYVSVVWMKLNTALEGLNILMGQNANPLERDHYEAILSLPALQYLATHPAMLKCAEIIKHSGNTTYEDLITRYEQYATLRLARDW